MGSRAGLQRSRVGRVAVHCFDEASLNRREGFIWICRRENEERETKIRKKIELMKMYNLATRSR